MAATVLRMHAIRDSAAAFRAAIERGALSEDPAHERFAGLFMYMFHDTAGAAWFKHRETRRYVTMGPATCKGLVPGDRKRPETECQGSAVAASGNGRVPRDGEVR